MLVESTTRTSLSSYIEDPGRHVDKRNADPVICDLENYLAWIDLLDGDLDEDIFWYPTHANPACGERVIDELTNSGMKVESLPCEALVVQLRIERGLEAL